MERKDFYERSASSLNKKILSGLLLLTLNASDFYVEAKENKTSNDIFCSLSEDSEKILKDKFMSEFTSNIDNISSVDELPRDISYRNSHLAEKYKFPKSIDLFPKNISSPTSSIRFSLWDRIFKVSMPLFIKIIDIKIDLNDKTGKWTIIVKLDLPWKIVYNAHFNYQEISELVYNIIKIPNWGGKMFFAINVKEITKDKSKRINDL